MLQAARLQTTARYFSHYMEKTLLSLNCLEKQSFLTLSDIRGVFFFFPLITLYFLNNGIYFLPYKVSKTLGPSSKHVFTLHYVPDYLAEKQIQMKMVKVPVLPE